MTLSPAAPVDPADSLRQMLHQGGLDFGGAYIAVNQIAADLRAGPLSCGPAEIEALVRALELPDYRSQKQAYFFYLAAAQTLAEAAVKHPDPRIGARAITALEDRLGEEHDGLQRALFEAVGCLPLDKPPWSPRPMPNDDPPRAERLPIVTDRWLARRGLFLPDRLWWRGRSLVGALGPGRLLIIKCLRAGESPAALAEEASWMTRLASLCRDWPERFQVPHPLGHGQGFLVQRPRPAGAPGATALHPGRYALAFTTGIDYFAYPNAPVGPGRLAPHQILELLERNAVLLGRLMALNICHTAPIPLFHNRSQRHRREDGGRYEWRRAGRLDRWLDSCRHPNLALSGLRDFEHFRQLGDIPLQRYDGMGVHLLSLFLVAGSYFRTAAPDRVGIDSAGRPVDARDLFDAGLLVRMLRAIVHGYRRGFVGAGGDEALPFDPQAVAAAMIEAMGVDRHMEEILRVVDQQQMTRAAFEAFLLRRGWTRTQAVAAPQGQADLILQTGPHLGGFNQAISLPELIRITGAAAADCVVRRFRHERLAVGHNGSGA